VFDWAIDACISGITRNPARDVKYPRSRGGGCHTWTRAQVAKFETVNPVGSKARLALALLLYPGQRKSDIILFGHQHVQDGTVTFTQQKNAERNPVTLSVPVFPYSETSSMPIMANSSFGLDWGTDEKVVR
jgi:hypothetical protein